MGRKKSDPEASGAGVAAVPDEWGMLRPAGDRVLTRIARNAADSVGQARALPQERRRDAVADALHELVKVWEKLTLGKTHSQAGDTEVREAVADFHDALARRSGVFAEDEIEGLWDLALADLPVEPAEPRKSAARKKASKVPLTLDPATARRESARGTIDLHYNLRVAGATSSAVAFLTGKALVLLETATLAPRFQVSPGGWCPSRAVVVGDTILVAPSTHEVALLSGKDGSELAKNALPDGRVQALWTGGGRGFAASESPHRVTAFELGEQFGRVQWESTVSGKVERLATLRVDERPLVLFDSSGQLEARSLETGSPAWSISLEALGGRKGTNRWSVGCDSSDGHLLVAHEHTFAWGADYAKAGGVAVLDARSPGRVERQILLPGRALTRVQLDRAPFVGTAVKPVANPDGGKPSHPCDVVGLDPNGVTLWEASLPPGVLYNPFVVRCTARVVFVTWWLPEELQVVAIDRATGARLGHAITRLPARPAGALEFQALVAGESLVVFAGPGEGAVAVLRYDF
jgi:hypothetical protein